jgi:SAM-dependent methyltransferase
LNQDADVIDCVAAYDALAPCYASISAFRSRYLQAIEQIIVAHALGRDSLLDIGAGDGTRTLRIAEAAKIRHVIALEPSAGMLARCQDELRTWQCRASEMPETSVRFDVITCLWNVIGHLQSREERVAALVKARERLSPGGIMFVDVNHRYNAAQYGWTRTLWRILFDRLHWSENNGDVVVFWRADNRTIRTRGHLFTVKEIKALFHEAGLFVWDQWVLNYQNGAECKSLLSGNLLFRLSSHRR